MLAVSHRFVEGSINLAKKDFDNIDITPAAGLGKGIELYRIFCINICPLFYKEFQILSYAQKTPKKLMRARARDRPMLPQATAEIIGLGRRFPQSPFTNAPRPGIRGISQNQSLKICVP